MMLPNTRKQATTFEYGGYAFKLSPRLSLMENLEDAVGMDYFKLLDAIRGTIALNPLWDEAEAAKAEAEERTYEVPQFIQATKPNEKLLIKLFFHLQDNETRFTEDDIHEYLYADMTTNGFGHPDVQERLLKVMMALKGLDYQDLIAAATAKKKLVVPAKAPTAV